MKRFKTVNDIPDFPIPKTEEERQQLISEFIEAGAIPKSQLRSYQYYLGSCRNSSIALWIHDKFWYLRVKFGSVYAESIQHFEDDTTSDVFIPIKVVNLHEINT